MMFEVDVLLRTEHLRLDEVHGTLIKAPQAG